MATRMQQRRGTASQWTSANPILNAGEMGWESDTNKFKIGDGTNHWANLDYFIDVNSTVNPAFGSSITFEGATDNAFETTLQVTDPTADRTITFPDVTGTVALTSDITVTPSSTNTLSNKSISLASNTVTGTTAEFNTALSDSNFVTTGDTGTVTSTMISDGTIVNGDINASAAIALSKLASGTSGQIIVANSSGVPTWVSETGDITISDTGVTAIATGVIVDADVNASAAIAQSKISGLTTDLAAKAPLAAPAFTGTATAVNLTISGDLTVNGTTTNLNSTSLVVEDKNIILGDAASPTDTTADGGGITLKGATDKTFNWVDSTDAWTSSEHINLASGKTLKYNGTDLVAAQSGNSGKYLTTDGTNTSWGTVSGYSAPTLGSTSIASGATVTTVAGLTLTAPTLTGTVTASGDINLSAAGGPGSVVDELTLLLMGAI